MNIEDCLLLFTLKQGGSVNKYSHLGGPFVYIQLEVCELSDWFYGNTLRATL